MWHDDDDDDDARGHAVSIDDSCIHRSDNLPGINDRYVFDLQTAK